jgi:hypothetical protein
VTKKRKKLRGTVEKVIKPAYPSDPEKAQIDVKDADDLYREIRIGNVVTDNKGNEASLKPGAKLTSLSKQIRMQHSRNRTRTLQRLPRECTSHPRRFA